MKWIFPFLLAFAGAAHAQDRQSSDLFRRLDRNGDGYLSRDEMRSAQAERANWIALDRNRDGRITENEFSAVR
jgi:Ca2+-binding EF-hand superfamily protein